MINNLIISLLITIGIQYSVYEGVDGRDSWNNFWLISGIFIGSLLTLDQVIPYFREKRLRGSEKLVYLDQYRAKKDAEKSKKSPAVQWVSVFTSCDSSEIEVVFSLLSAKGINCHVANRHVASMFPSVAGLEMKIQVEQAELTFALEELKKHDIVGDQDSLN